MALLLTFLLIFLFSLGKGDLPVASGKMAFIIIDVQNDFMPPNGSLAVPDGDATIPVINAIRANYSQYFALIALSQDWHCLDHISFQSAHTGTAIRSVVPIGYNRTGALCEGYTVNYTKETEYGVNCSTGVTPMKPEVILNQTMWPNHCVQNSSGAEFDLRLVWDPKNDVVVQKGNICYIDSYSALFSNGRFYPTTLPGILKDRGISTIFVVGVAADFCVAYTAEDGLQQLGLHSYIIEDATRGVTAAGVNATKTRLQMEGVVYIQSSDLPFVLGLNNNDNDNGNEDMIITLSVVLPIVAIVLVVAIVRHLRRNQEGNNNNEKLLNSAD